MMPRLECQAFPLLGSRGMPLINCKECNWVVADDAKVCPHCGHSIVSEGCFKAGCIVVLILVGVWILLFLIPELLSTL